MAASRDDESANVWVLDTFTKGTGANIVPLERVLKHGSERVPGFALPARVPAQDAPAEPRAPYRFRIVDVMTRQVLADDADARHALQTLERARSIVDVTVYVWEPEAERWRRLTFGETKALWDRRTGLPANVR